MFSRMRNNRLPFDNIQSRYVSLVKSSPQFGIACRRARFSGSCRLARMYSVQTVSLIRSSGHQRDMYGSVMAMIDSYGLYAVD